MITEKDLRQAIAECEGIRHPTASTCLKLAAYYTILNQITGEVVEGTETRRDYSFETRPTVKYTNTDFSKVVEKKGLENCFPVLDEIMGALCVCNPKLYNSAMRQLEDV